MSFSSTAIYLNTCKSIFVLELYLIATYVVALAVSKQEKLNFLNIAIGTKETALSRALVALVESEYNNKIKEKLFNELFKLKVFDILFPIFLIVVLKSKVGSFLNKFSS